MPLPAGTPPPFSGQSTGNRPLVSPRSPAKMSAGPYAGICWPMPMDDCIYIWMLLASPLPTPNDKLELTMTTWHSRAMGDGVEAFEPSMQLHETFIAFARARGGVPAHAAVFSRYDLQANIVTWYFSPEATTLAKAFGAAPCEKPISAEGFGLLSGDARAWEAHFPGYIVSRRMR